MAVTGTSNVSSSSQVQRSNLPSLQRYMAPVVATAPYGFAELDPTSTLMMQAQQFNSWQAQQTSAQQALDAANAMVIPPGGKSKNKREAVAKAQKAYDQITAAKPLFDPNQVQQLTGLMQDERSQAGAGRDALQRIIERQESGQHLTPEESKFVNSSLDTAFEAAHKFGTEDLLRMAQGAAGGRGLRTSDSPIMNPLMRETRNMALGLGSERARMGLNATMQFSAQQQAFDMGLHEFSTNMAFNRWNARQNYRFGAGAQAVGLMNQRINTTSTGTDGGSTDTGILGTFRGLADIGGRLPEILAGGAQAGTQLWNAAKGIYNFGSSFLPTSGAGPNPHDAGDTRLDN